MRYVPVAAPNWKRPPEHSVPVSLAHIGLYK